MKYIKTAAALAMLMALVSSCTYVKVNPGIFDGIYGGGTGERIKGSDTFTTVSYAVPQFDRIDVSIYADMTYEMTDDEPSVEIYTSDNLVEHLNFKVEDGCLKIKFDDGWRARYDEMRITVKSKTLSELNLRGAGDFDIPDGLECERFALAVQGAGDVEANSIKTVGNISVTIQGAGDVDMEDIDCDKFTALIQGAGDVDASGKCNLADLTIQGAGDINVSRLEAGDISSSVQGVGNIVR